MVGLGSGPTANGQANNGHETEPTATASPSTSAARGRGRCATTPWVVTSPEIPTPIPLAFP